MARILLVEDDPETLDSITLWLELAGFDVSVARDGRDALTVLSEETPDLIITDLVMPQVSGVDLINAVRNSMSSHKDIPILVVTGYYMDMATEALTAGADRAMGKPVDPEALAGTIRYLLGPGHSASEQQRF